MNSQSSPLPQPERLASLDTLRGLDMLIIVGGAGVLKSFIQMTDSSILKRIEEELHHPEWHGFTFYDLVFPLFMFLAGVSFAFSLGKRLERGESKATLQRHIITRGLLLVLFGAIYNGLLSLDFANVRYASVLGRIGLGYMGGALIALHARDWRSRAIWCAGILLGYWAALKLIPVPEFGAGDLTPGHTLVGYIDRLFLPGKLYKDVRDPEGLFSTIPACVNVLAGIMTGTWLKRDDRSGYQKVAGMFIAGLIAWGIAKGWDIVFPINKNLWTSSFVMVTVGWSLMFLSVFYLVIDVWKIRSWILFFVVIGANPLFIYMASRFIDFQEVALFLLRGSGKGMHALFADNAGFVLKWGLLYVFYRQKIFWKI